MVIDSIVYGNDSIEMVIDEVENCVDSIKVSISDVEFNDFLFEGKEIFMEEDWWVLGYMWG